MIIPAYNEENRIAQMLKEHLKVNSWLLLIYKAIFIDF